MDVPSLSWRAYEAASYVQDLCEEAEECRARFLSLGGAVADNEYVPAIKAGFVARRKAGRVDQYVALNPVRSQDGPRAGIQTLHADLDYYKSPPWKAAEPHAVFTAVLETLAASNIAPPSLAVATGRGLQLVWCVGRVVNRAERKATAAMQALVKLLAPFGADPACTDLARLFRLPGSVNGKNGAVARLIHRSEERHDFDALCRAILGPRPPKQSTQP